MLTIERWTGARSAGQPLGMEAERLVPEGAVVALIEWPLPPDESEVAIEEEAAEVIARAMVRMGRVAFRWDDSEAPPGGVVHREPRRSWRDWGLDRVESLFYPWGIGDRAGFDVVETSEMGVVRALFSWGGWSVGVQAALVFEAGAERGPIVQAVGRGLDWRGRGLPAGCLLLVGSGHDGGEAVVAAVSDGVLAEFEEVLREELSSALARGAAG